MKRELNDFSLVRSEHLAIHDQLLNWARVVGSGRRSYGQVHPMFRGYRHGYEEGKSSTVDSASGWAVEKLVVALPEKHRTAIQWAYCFPWVPIHKVRRALGLTEFALCQLVHDARTMLKNRGQA